MSSSAGSLMSLHLFLRAWYRFAAICSRLPCGRIGLYRCQDKIRIERGFELTYSVLRSLATCGVIVMPSLISLTLTGGGRRKDKYQYIGVYVKVQLTRVIVIIAQVIGNFGERASTIDHLLTDPIGRKVFDVHANIDGCRMVLVDYASDSESDSPVVQPVPKNESSHLKVKPEDTERPIKRFV